MNTNGDRIIVDGLRAGTACPSCLQPLKEGEAAYICHKCGAMNHEICWQRCGCGSYHCRAGSSAPITGGSADIVITKADLENLKEVPANSRYGTAAIADEIQQQQKLTWSPLAIFALVIGLGTLAVSLVNFSTEKVSEYQTAVFLLSLGGCLVSVLVGAISIATFQNNSTSKGLPLSFAGMGSAIIALLLTLYPLMNPETEQGEQFKPDMKQIGEAIRTAAPAIKGPLMANVHIKAGSGFRMGMGSGIALCNRDAFTYILTNAHVLTLGTRVKSLEELKAKAGNVEVTFYSGETTGATPVWLAPDEIDLALIRVSTPNGFVPQLKYQQGRALTMGQRVFAIGNPIGLNWTYTDGVISALRKNRHGSREITVVQMQTPLNHGNSGGGLYDLEGYLIGVNTWIYAKTATEGLNFSIAIDEFFQLLEPEWLELLALSGAGQLAEKEPNR